MKIEKNKYNFLKQKAIERQNKNNQICKQLTCIMNF